MLVLKLSKVKHLFAYYKIQILFVHELFKHKLVDIFARRIATCQGFTGDRPNNGVGGEGEVAGGGGG